jgi:hypothetical protein
MALGRGPHHAFCPLRKLPQLLHLGVAFRGIVRQGQTAGVKDFGLSPHLAQQSRSLFGQQLTVRTLTGRPVQQQNARRMTRSRSGQQPGKIRDIKQVVVDIGQVRV